MGLHAELQETKELVQARHEGRGDQGSLLPRSMRLDVPKFNGANSKSWILAINEYFALLATPDKQRLKDLFSINTTNRIEKYFRTTVDPRKEKEDDWA
uniref:Prolyl oligopeptidase family protein n=1 Tax=Tanacetum cinerariifolium TaxID=118510 RepID=A0A699L4L9_TANCI|nr:prolyl oligopeptidase family protein [Tanacetum cinerariifolium]